jgi:hypothetical protein
VVEQVQEHRLGPLEIVDVQEKRPLLGKRLEQLSDFEEQLFEGRSATTIQTVQHLAAGTPTCDSASDSGQKVIPSPYGKQRPRST